MIKIKGKNYNNTTSTMTKVTLSKITLHYLLTFYPIMGHPHPPIKGHIFSILKLCHILPYHFFLILI